VSITESTARRAGLGDPGDADAAQRRIDRRLEPDDAGAGADDRRRVRQLLERHEPRRHAEARQHVFEQVQRAAVDRRAADDLVAGLRASRIVEVAPWPDENTSAASARSSAAAAPPRSPSVARE
jgi:hypothetical protein